MFGSPVFHSSGTPKFSLKAGFLYAQVPFRIGLHCLCSIFAVAINLILSLTPHLFYIFFFFPFFSISCFLNFSLFLSLKF
jgi:hypothetical protein